MSPQIAVEPVPTSHDVMKSTEADELLTLASVATILGVSVRHVYDLRARNELPTIHLSRKVVRVRRSDLEAYIAAGERAS